MLDKKWGQGYTSNEARFGLIMSVTITTVSPRIAVQDADDPFKKYWLAILLGFAFTGLWLLMPLMGERAIGSASVNTTKPKIDENAEQALTPILDDGPNLSMDGAGAKKKITEDGYAGSMLYTAPEEEAPADATAAASASAAGGKTLASELKSVSSGKSDGNGGWGDKVAQRGFNSPKLSGSSLGGLGKASGGSAASAGGGMGAFGSKNSQIGYAGTKGLPSGAMDGEKAAAAGSRGVAALRSAAAAAQAAAANRSGDGATNSLAKAFDGAKSQNSITGGLGNAVGASYEMLDAAPVNLKLSDPKLNEKELEEPPSAEAPPDPKSAPNIGADMAMSIVGMAIGGAIGGVAGGMVAQMITSALQKTADFQREKAEADAKYELAKANNRMGRR